MMTNLKIWGRNIEPNTLLQAERSARSPVVDGHVALMPDAHVGIGATVGSVIPTKNAIIPAAVGVDIGCGMIAVETDLSASDLPDDLQPLVSRFGRSVPAGVGRGRNPSSRGHLDRAIRRRATAWMSDHPHDLGDLGARALVQLGTLGSGNHFLEVCLDERDVVWVVLHSGSRGVGNRLADRHIKLAKAQEQGLEDPDLAYFLDGTAEFGEYIADMLWAQSYALENRELMMEAALGDLFEVVGQGREKRRINCHHNFAAVEEHQGRELWITRKGAIRAARGDYGVIPGSMGTCSYVVEGLGAADSYTSASHGAGRRMSRGQARRELTQESLVEMMEGKAWNQNAKALLDEHPMAYKDIDEVMEDQRDLVRIVHTLRQVANYKGA
ncbi:MAG: RtcB family protein [Chloroflexi bacterium]|nr:RtcB family protein [Chloroflexota bacterium]